MALINCSECGNLMSDKAQNCPKCGAPNPNTPMQAPMGYSFNPCAWHGNAPAVSSCVTCGRAMCKTCVDTAPFAIDNKPQCNECSLQMLDENIAANKKIKFWSIVKLVFLLFFIFIGLAMYFSNPGDWMSAWIVAGIGGLPSALKNFVTRSAEEKWADEIVTRVDPGEGCFQQMLAFVIKVIFAFLLAPVGAIWFTIKNSIAIAKSGRAIKADQEDYDTILARMQGEENMGEIPVSTVGQETQMASCESAQPAVPAQQVASNLQSADAVYTQPIQPSPVTPPSQASTSKKQNNTLLVGVIIGVFALLGLVAGYIMWYVPYAKDRDALRTYVVATNVFLRSSKVAGVEYNMLDKIPYGSELITYSKDVEWAEVKVNGTEGFVASPYLLEWDDFKLLNDVWGSADVKEYIESSKCRLAILDYCKRNELNTGSEGWQLHTLHKTAKSNNVLYPRLNNGYDKFTEFAFILKNNATQERKFAIYSFDEETEKPIFLYDEPAPVEGQIKQIRYSGNRYVVNYTGNVAAASKTAGSKKNSGIEFKATAPNAVPVGEVFKLCYEVTTDDCDDFRAPQIKDFKILSGPNRSMSSYYNSNNGVITKGKSVKYNFTLKANKEGVFVIPPATAVANGNLITSNSVRVKIVPAESMPEYNAPTIISEVASDGKEKKAADERVYESVDQAPEYPGGMQALMAFIRKNVVYPPFSRAFGVQGKVVVSFVVNEDGSTTDFSVLRGVDEELDGEALRVLKSMPKWKPGKQNGEPVKVKFAVPVNFKLS